MASKRIRGLNAFLVEISNTTSSLEATPRKRACADRASCRIREEVKKGVNKSKLSPLPTPRKSPRQSPRPNYIDTDTTQDLDPSHITLRELLKYQPHVLQQGMQCIQRYTERNTTYVVQKANALQIFAGSVLGGSGIIEALDLAAACTSFAARTIRKWATDVFSDYFALLSCLDDVTDERLEMELESGKGKYPKWVSLMTDENFKMEARQYILDSGYVKGKPNLTLQDFVLWVKEHHGVEICTSTASLWLHDMGFSYKQFSKGVYFDGHEREDVVKDRKLYLETLSSYSHRMWISHSPAPNPMCRPVIRVCHDESTFYANADQAFHWTDGSKQALKQKSLGQAIMVSDFLEEVGGLLQHQDEKARLMLEHQTEGYFNNQMLLSQVNRAITIFERKYPEAQGLFIFDHAPSHMKRPEDALNAERMNVKDGGRQPFMKDTIWEGRVQRMVTSGGTQKGMKTVLEERGVETDGLNADKLRELLRQYEVNLFIFVTFHGKPGIPQEFF